MKTTVYPLRLSDELYGRVKAVAEQRGKKVSDMFRDIIGYGLESLPPMPDMRAVILDTWDKLGPAPEVNYDEIDNT